MRSRVQKWGNSLALRIPSSLAEATDLAEGSEVELEVRKGKLIVERADQKFTLDGLLSGVSSANLHEEVSSGERKGKETW